MIKLILGWFNANPLIGVIICVAIATGMVFVAKDAQLSEVRKESAAKDKRIEALNGDLRTAQNNVAALNLSIGNQNQSIANLAAQGVTASQKFDKIIAGMSAANAGTARKLEDIRNAKPGPDKCASALALIKGAAK